MQLILIELNGLNFEYLKTIKITEIKEKIKNFFIK